ncbi:MAG: NAD-dependent deacylase, partial [Flavobacteriaceae bacterium]|nr:NAD-dependent deacylase [Flavobacteriaceae bacterium]
CWGAHCDHGHQLRPHIVWFGEEVPLMPVAANLTRDADILLIIGTSMQVYPAAGLVHYAPDEVPIYFVDPKPSVSEADFRNLNVYAESAVSGVPKIIAALAGN